MKILCPKVPKFQRGQVPCVLILMRRCDVVSGHFENTL